MILTLKVQFPSHVQKLMTLVDTKLLLLNQSWPQVVCDSCGRASGPVNHHRGAARGAAEMSELLYLPLRTPIYPLHPVWDITPRHVFAERRVGQAWWYTSAEGKAYLIAARMLNYAVRELLKWSLEDKQATLANMTPHRGRRTFTGAYPITYICFVWIVLIHGVLLQFILVLISFEMLIFVVSWCLLFWQWNNCNYSSCGFSHLKFLGYSPAW